MGISEDKKRAIELLRDRGVAKKRTAVILGTTRDTVGKYEPDGIDGWDKSLEVDADLVWETLAPEMNPNDVVEEDEYVPADAEGNGGDRIEGTPPEDTPLRDETEQELSVADDYESMKPGDFLREFFDEMEVGVKSKFIRLQARRADRRKELPDEEKMRSDLEGMSSGIAGKECEYVAEEYWAEAQKYLSEASASVFRGGSTEGRTSSGSEGEMVSADGSQDANGHWVTMPDGTRQFGQMVPDGQGGMRFQPQQPPGQPPGQPQMGYGGPRQNTQDSEAMKELLREVRELRSSQNEGGKTLQDQIQEFAEIQQTLKNLQDGDGGNENSEMVRTLQQELRQLRSEMSQGQAAQQQAQNPQEAIFQKMLSDESVNSDQLLKFADRIEGQQDPEVRKKEIDRELEMRKMEQKAERTEKVMSTLEGLASTFGSAIGQAMMSDDGASQQSSQGQQSQQGSAQVQQEQAAPQPVGDPSISDFDTDLETDGSGRAVRSGMNTHETWECDECGAVTEQDPTLSGKVCKQCDFSIQPCPDCSMPVEIPPEEMLDRGGCPECSAPVMLPDDPSEKIACLDCDWVGPAEDALGDTIECDNCGKTQPVMGS